MVRCVVWDSGFMFVYGYLRFKFVLEFDEEVDGKFYEWLIFVFLLFYVFVFLYDEFFVDFWFFECNVIFI